MYTAILCVLTLLFFLLPHAVLAWDGSSPHPRVLSFSVTKEGDAYGELEGGVTFTQTTLLATDTVRVQQFKAGTYSHYIVNGEVVFTLEELSGLLASV